EFAANAASLDVFAHHDPPQMPGPVRHRRGSIVREANRLAVLFERDTAMSLTGLHFMVILQYPIERFEVDWQKEPGFISHGDQGRGIGRNRRTNHRAPFPARGTSVTIAR